MKKFKDISIQYKILSGYLAILSLTLVVGFYFIYTTKQIIIASRNLELRNFPGVELVADIERNILMLKNLDKEIEHLSSEAEITRFKGELDLHSQKAGQLIEEFKDIVKNEPENLRRIELIKDLYQGFRDYLYAEFSQWVKQKTRTIGQEESVMVSRLESALEDLRNEDISIFSLSLGRISDLADNSRNVYFWLLFLKIFISVSLGLWIAGIIVGPVKELVFAMGRLGEGDLDYKIEAHAKDEIGSLEIGFMAMAERLKNAYSVLQSERDELEVKVKERTKDLEQNQLYLKMITDGVDEGIMLLDSQYKILWTNAKVMHFFGKHPDEIIGKHCYELIHKLEALPVEECPLAEIFKTKEPASSTHIHLDKDKNKFYVKVTAYPILDQQGKIEQVIHVSRDVTEEKASEEKISRYVRSLEEMQKDLQDKIEDLERFSNLAVDRELKMVELKEKVRELEEKINKAQS